MRSLTFWLGLVVFSFGWLHAVSLLGRPSPAAAAGMFATGVALVMLGLRPRSWRAAGHLAALLALVAAAQACTLPLAYWLGSRIHRLDFLSPVLGRLLSALGVQVHSGEGVLYVVAGGQLLPFTTTWEKLGVLPALWILIGGAMFLLGQRRCRPVRAVCGVVSVTVAYVVLRYVALVLAVMLHEDPRHLDPASTSVVELFRSPWWHLVTFVPLAALCAVVLPSPVRAAVRLGLGWRGGRARWASVLSAAGAAVVALGFTYHDSGAPKAGRLVLDEVHSGPWERASRPLDTSWYGRDSTYNYATLLALLRQHYAVELQESGAYDDARLDGVDVLVIKTATRPFARGEVDAVERFVARGGGLLVVGDHTNLLGMSDNMNQLTERFGVRFRMDAANRLDDGYLATFTPSPLVAHPVVRDIEELEFMTSCTLEASLWADDIMVVGNTFSDAADYSQRSFFGNVIPDTEDSFGPHVLCSGVRHGKGRVLVFSDSTVLSSFGVMFPGRPEFVLAMVDWLNRENVSWFGKRGLVLLGALLLVCGGLLGLFGARPMPWLVAALPVAVVVGASVGAVIGRLQSGSAVAAPPIRDRVSEVSFVAEGCRWELAPSIVESAVPRSQAYDTFYVWVQRLGRLPRVRALEEAIVTGDAVVMVCPVARPSPAEIEALCRFVEQGGRLLVLDSVTNGASQANSILGPFGLSVRSSAEYTANEMADPEWLRAVLGEDPGTPGLGELPPTVDDVLDASLVVGDIEADPIPARWPTPTLVVEGGLPIFRTASGNVCAALQPYGRGRVIAVSRARMFSREGMGEPTDLPPEGDPRWGGYDSHRRLFEDYLFGASRPVIPVAASR